MANNGKEWLNEADIINISYPFVEVTLSATKAYTVPLNQLKEVIIEGKTAMSRKGSIKFVDVDGEWPDILMKVGQESNRFDNVRKPNLELKFGWKRLRGYKECIRQLDGMVIRSAFDLTDDGQTMVTLEYIETIVSVTNTIRYIYPEDIKVIWEQSQNDLYYSDELSVSKRLNWLTKWGNQTTVCDILKKNKIQFEFEQTANNDLDTEFTVGFGDYLVDVINELTAKAQRPTKEKGKNYSYERGVPYQKFDLNNKFMVTVIPYKWKAAPDEDNPQPENVFENMEVGPVLSYKKTAEAGQKQILAFTSDLNSHTSLMMQSQDEINKKLMDFSEDDMEALNKIMQEGGLEALNKDIKYGMFASKNSRDKTDKRNNVRIEILNLVKQMNQEKTSSQNSQLKAILANNVFKSTVKIIGDPTFGTDFEPLKLKMNTNFDKVGGFGKTFGSRTWALTYVKHTFAEGSFETEMELLAYPLPAKDIKPDNLATLLNDGPSDSATK